MLLCFQLLPTTPNTLSCSFVFLFYKLIFMSQRILIMGLDFFFLFFSAMCLFFPKFCFSFVCFCLSCLIPALGVWWSLDSLLIYMPEAVKYSVKDFSSRPCWLVCLTVGLMGWNWIFFFQISQKSRGFLFSFDYSISPGNNFLTTTASS